MKKKNISYILGLILMVLGLFVLLRHPSNANYIIGCVIFLAGGVVATIFTKAPTIARRELASFFVSPIAYILIAAYVLVTAYFFNVGIQATQRAQMEQTFVIMTWMSLFLCPIITMRLFSEEARSGTLETMLTAPVTDLDLTLGKYLGGFAFFVAMQVPTLVFVGILAHQGAPDYGVIIASYVGNILFGAMLISIGLLVSAFTRNQVIAAFVSFVAMFLLFFLGVMGQNIPGAVGKVVNYMGAATHYMDFTRGLILSHSVIYYVTITAFFLFLTVRAVESHKWR